ncbi:alpha-amylase [Chryseobacterium pennipullorum]|uniref:Alpha-amylase n=1 Tax=Chryseobacterium pennipullorum TaxID=2258963 RepID=A0A3D9B420_9FLAO|nr:alpha-amylase [Chryseobacterium pennipullorum]REC47922.1 alpha-amylase [Chryseobacterium pennipullorum]
MKKTYFFLSMLALVWLGSCQTNDEMNTDPSAKAEVHDKMIQVTRHDGRPFSTGNGSGSTAGKFVAGPGGGVMMQGFYWDVPDGGNWWNTVKSKLTAWSGAGIGAVWLPPASKAQNGAYSMGYDPTDYYDFGDLNQNGTVETRFGSRAELEELITKAHAENMQVYADIVINHNSGGQSEANPYTGTNTWTNFSGVASGKFTRNYNDFYKNAYGNNDEGSFGGFPDLCHANPHVQDWLWGRDDSVAKYYKNVMKFDGWRFDYVKGFGPWVVNTWNSKVGGFSVGELWDSNVNTLEWWANNANSSVFDFAAYYKMDEAFDNGNLNVLNDDMMWKRNPYKAVTFVANHDTDIIYNKMPAYAYILTHEGYPTIFYRDYEEWLNKDKLNNLIWIHNNKATGNTSILYTDNDEYIARRNGYNGNPGLVVYINTSSSWQERWIETNWSSQQIKDFTGNSTWYPTTQGDKWVKIQCPPNSYSVWSLNQ